MNPLAVLKLATGVVSIGKLFWNAGRLIRLAKSMVPMFTLIVKEKRWPNLCESKDFIRAMAELFRAGVIDIPGVEESDIAKALDDIEKEIECKAA